MILDHGTARAIRRVRPLRHDGARSRCVVGSADRPIRRAACPEPRQLDELVTDAELERTGHHPVLGDVTMRQLLATWAVHDLDHTSQVFAAMSATYDQTVGPWKEYLGILLRREDPSAVPG